MKSQVPYKIAAVVSFFLFPVGCLYYQIREDKFQITQKQKLLDQSLECSINGNDTTYFYKLNGDDLKTLIKFKDARKLEIK